MNEPRLRLGRYATPLWLLVLCALALPLVIFDFSILITVLRALRSHRNFGDSWNAMRIAWTWFVLPHAGSLYEQVFLTQHVKFQYPPSSLLPFWLAYKLHHGLTNPLLNSIGLFFTFLEAAAVGFLGYRAVLAAGKNRAVTFVSTRAGLVVACLLAFVLVCATVSFAPVWASLELGQIQTWLNAWFVLACVSWIFNRRLLAGILVGFICLLKPQFALFLLWAVLRRQRTFLLGWAMVLVPVGIASLAVFGLRNHWDYFSALQFIARRGEAYYGNQSINGLLNRYLNTADSLTFDGYSFPPYNSIVYIGTLITSLPLIAGALLYRFRSRTVNVFDFLIAGLTFTIASPIAWEHHYGFLPVILVLVGFAIPGVKSPVKRLVFAIALPVCWALTGFHLEIYNRHYTGVATLIQSPLLAGSLGILAMLYLMRDCCAEKLEITLRTNATVRAAPVKVAEAA